jgi:hypothetical protein
MRTPTRVNCARMRPVIAAKAGTQMDSRVRGNDEMPANGFSVLIPNCHKRVKL